MEDHIVKLILKLKGNMAEYWGTIGSLGNWQPLPEHYQRHLMAYTSNQWLYLAPVDGEEQEPVSSSKANPLDRHLTFS